MNKRDRMNDRISKHGFDLIWIFNLEGTDQIELCKKVHRIEARARRLAEEFCNGAIDIDEWEKYKDAILSSLDKVLNFKKQNIPVFCNGDPRGYILKIKSEYVRKHTLKIYNDWGGYGIIAPEFDGN
jgi:hypothetical protein